MALAVTHVLIAILILDIFRHYVFGKERFPRYLLVIGGIAGLAPDLDIPIGWFISWISGNTVNLHGDFSHSLFFVIFLLLAGAIRSYQVDTKWANILYVISAGWLIHLLLDCAFGGYSTFLWPIIINTKVICPEWGLNTYRTGIDAIILVLWLVHEELHSKIKDYF